MIEYLPLFVLGTISLIAIAFLCWALRGYLKQDKPEQQKLIAFDNTMRGIADAYTAPQSDDTEPLLSLWDCLPDGSVSLEDSTLEDTQPACDCAAVLQAIAYLEEIGE